MNRKELIKYFKTWIDKDQKKIDIAGEIHEANGFEMLERTETFFISFPIKE